MIVTYTVIGRYAYLDVWVVHEETGIWDIGPFEASDCFWIVPGTID